MTENEKRIAEELDGLFRKAKDDGKDSIEIALGDGTALSLTPLFDPSTGGRFMDTTSDRRFMSADYVVVEGPSAAAFSADPRKLCGQIADYASAKARYASKAEALKAYWRQHKDSFPPTDEEEPFGYYSDWFKDLFGRRPCGWEEPVLP